MRLVATATTEVDREFLWGGAVEVGVPQSLQLSAWLPTMKSSLQIPTAGSATHSKSVEDCSIVKKTEIS